MKGFIDNKGNMMGATNGAGIAYSSGLPEFILSDYPFSICKVRLR